jgi:hypothetical protein
MDKGNPQWTIVIGLTIGTVLASRLPSLSAGWYAVLVFGTAFLSSHTRWNPLTR